MALLRNLDYEGIARIKSYPVAPASTFLEGDFLTFDGSGRLQQTVGTGANYGSGKIMVGRALENAVKDDGSLKTHVAVLVCEPGTRFKLPIYHGTPASAVFASSTLGTAYELRNTTGGFPAVDISQTSNTKVRVVDGTAEGYTGWPDVSGTSSTQYGEVWVEFIGTSCVLSTVS